MRTLLLLLLLVASGLLASAQETRVTGRVTNANGEPVAGASVVVKGQTNGVATNLAGEYTISVPRGATLVISSIGFTPQEITANRTYISATLIADNTQLSDVVVVGYGTQRRSAITGAVVTIKNEALTRRQVASTSNLLQGLAPGVTVQQQSGRPGADAASIRIRGTSSMFAGSDPLIVIDGVVSTLDNIDPNAIESINILKDAASTAIYGSRASNGVILVRTKRATGNGLRVSYNAFVSKQVATAIPKRTSAIEHMELSNISERNRTGNPGAFLYAQSLIDKYKTTPANNLDVIDTDWLDLLLTNNGLLQNHNVQIVSGGERLNVFTSVSYLKQQGLIKNNSFEKYDVRFNPDFKISDKLTLSGVFSYNNSKTINPSTGSAEFIIRQAIGLPAIGAGKFGEGMYGTAGQTNNRNPLAMAEAAGTSVRNDNTFLTRAGFTYRPVKNLELEVYWARETRNPTTKTFVKNVDIYQANLTTQTYDKIGVWPGSTSLGQSYFNNVYKTYLGQATYSGKSRNHNFKVLTGAQSELFTNSFFSASRTGFINPNQPYLNLGSGTRDNNAAASELALAGFFSRLNYNYAEKYFIELNGRYDGSSRFSQALDKQWGFFPSVSAGWIVSKESFLDASQLINFAKLRGSVGTLGNQNFNSFYPFDAFYGQSAYSNPDNGTNAYFNNVTTLGYAILEFPNQQIEWEKSNQWNIGIDLGLAKNITVTADYYVRSLEDMILRQPLPQTGGGLINPLINAGRMENRGWELSLNYKRKFKDFGLDLTGMISDVVNEVTSLGGNPFLDEGSLRTQVGQAYRSYFGYRAIGYFQDTNQVKSSPVQFGTPFNANNPGVGPKPGDVQYADISGADGKPDGKIDALDRTFIGNRFPRYEYSVNLNVTYKNVDLNIFGQGVGKRDNYLTGTGAIPFSSTDFAASLLEIHKDYWTTSNPDATFPRLLPAGSGGNNYVASSRWIRGASYFRIKNLNVGYKIPEPVTRAVKIASARIYISAANVITFTDTWKGFDPEINDQNAEFHPLMKTFTAGINVNF
ncbi:MAG: TonB-dependent receptor [Chitinophagaceae bacterium]